VSIATSVVVEAHDLAGFVDAHGNRRNRPWEIDCRKDPSGIREAILD